MTIRIINGDCMAELATLEANSIDSCVTDPPYHLTTGKKGGTGPASVNLGTPQGRARVTTGFMGMKWDGGDVAHNPALWAEVLRVLKPGAYLLAFGGTRTYHRLACAIEDAGFEIRDQIGWAFGSGFPKSHNGPWGGTALKPAWEPIVMARKPLATIATNVQDVVESNLRARGVTGEIRWQKNAAQHAGNRKAKSHSASAEDSPAKTADASGIESIGPRIDNSTETAGINGQRQTPDSNANSAERPTLDSGNKLSTPTAGSALAAEKLNCASSLSTTSTAEEQSIERQPTEKCMPNCAEPGSLPDTESFAGIATGLTGSLAVVHIKRNQSGNFEWPDGLPKSVPSVPLTVAANVQQFGTGGLNIDGCRIETSTKDQAYIMERVGGFNNTQSIGGNGKYSGGETMDRAESYDAAKGRWPANLIHDGSEEVLACFPEAPGQLRHVGPENGAKPSVNTFGDFGPRGDKGSAARFFYSPKASKYDRDDGLYGMEADYEHSGPRGHIKNGDGSPRPRPRPRSNAHPTVKPTNLMRYLCRLVTPKDGTVLDPFMGSGSTLKAAELDGFSAIGIEIDPEYCAIARRRIASDAPLFTDTTG